MRIRAFLLLLLILPASRTIAQRTLIWEPDTSLRVAGSVAYDRVRVIDDRRNKISIGFLKTGAFDRYAELQTDDSVNKCLEKFALQILRGAQTAPGELLIVLRDLRMEDTKGDEAIGTVHLRADLFTGNANAYVHLKNFDSLYETKHRRLTREIQDIGSASILHLLTQAKDTYPAGDPNAVYTLEEAIARERTFRQSLPVYKDETPKRGMYTTVDSFFQLQTSNTDFIFERIASMDGPPRFLFYRKNAKGKKGHLIKPEECFAIYNDKNWYVSRRSGFSVLKKEESGDFYTTMQLKGLEDNSTMAFALMIMPLSPIMGVAALVGDASTKNYPTYRVRMMPDAGKLTPVGRVR